jgi:phosphatidate cytidylyltransferase
MLFRIVSSLIVLPLFVWLCLYASPPVTQSVFMIFIILAWLEYWKMMRKKGLNFSLWPGLIFLIVFLGQVIVQEVTPARWPEILKELGPAWLLAVFLIVVAMFRITVPDLEKGVERFFAEMVGPLYLGGLGIYLLLLNALPEGGWWLLLVFWFSWVYDAGAYFVGKTLGKKKFSLLSPKKTWEGFLGGIVVNALFAMLVLPFFMPQSINLNQGQLLLISLIASVLAQSGDLLESMLKRFTGSKDSGALVPKHGGFMDKMDSALFVAPFLYWIALLWGK